MNEGCASVAELLSVTVIWPATEVSIELSIPLGSVPATERLSPAVAFVRTKVIESSAAVSGSTIEASVSAIAWWCGRPSLDYS